MKSVLGDRGAAFAETSYLLECVGELQHTEIVTIAADDLDADRQTILGKSRRH